VSKGKQMKKDLHPNMVDCTVTCACGNSFVNKALTDTLRVDI